MRRRKLRHLKFAGQLGGADGFSAGDVEIDGAFGFARHFGCGGGEAFGLLRGLSLSARVGILLGGKSLPTQLLPAIFLPRRRLWVQCLPNFFPARRVVRWVSSPSRKSSSIRPALALPASRNITMCSAVSPHHTTSKPPNRPRGRFSWAG